MSTTGTAWPRQSDPTRAERERRFALQEALNHFVEEHNRDPRSFVWAADPDAIVETVRRGYHALASRGRQPG